MVEGGAVRFLFPQWLWLLGLVPLALLFILFEERSRRKRFAKFASEPLWAAIAPGALWGARRRKSIVWLLSLSFVVLSLARPQWGTHEEVAHMTGLDVVVALDVSNSMETEDVVPSRLQKAKHLVRNVVDHLAGDRVGLIAFAGSAYLACPLTTDLDYVLESLSIQSPPIIANQGTDISLALQTAYTALDRGAMLPDAHAAGDAPIASRAVVLVTDGEDHEGGMDEMAAQLKKAGIKLYILGVGTERGGPVPMRNSEGRLEGYKRDSHGQPVVSSYRPKEMLKLAAAAGGHYWNASESENEVVELLHDLGTLGRADLAEHRYLVYEERFQYPLAIAVLLLLLEMSLSTRIARATRPARPAASAMIVAVSLLAVSRGASASPLDSTDTYVENKKGVDAYSAGKLDEAKQHFSSAQAREPSRPELFYNQGLVELGSGDADGAIRSFGEAARGGLATGNPDILAKSLFNLGSAFTKKNDHRNALRSYLGAIDAAKTSHDAKLEAEARKNVELLGQKQQEQKQNQNQNQDQKQDQKQQQQQSQGGDGQDQKNQKPDDQKNDQKNDQKKDQAQNQTPHYEDHPKEEKFNSKKLTREDAERVFSDLSNRELDLQVKQRQQNANRNNDNEDW
jgi:Ca-activated chloride channel family protein